MTMVGVVMICVTVMDVAICVTVVGVVMVGVM